MLARLDTMPVTEQAKGVIMAQSRCTETEVFDRLRRASQHTNVPVRDLAAQIVATAAGRSARVNRRLRPDTQDCLPESAGEG